MVEMTDWDSIPDYGLGGFVKPPLGAYEFVIHRVIDNPSGEYMELQLDIASGDYAGHFAQDYESRVQRFGTASWPVRHFRNYGAKSKGFFKGLIMTLERENPGFKWAWDEDDLVGLTIGGVLKENSYKANDGNMKKRYSVDFIPKSQVRQELETVVNREYQDDEIPF